MSRLDEPTDRAAVQFSASLTVKAHADGRRCCIECPGDGCRQNAWARDQLETTPASRPAAYDGRRS